MLLVLLLVFLVLHLVHVVDCAGVSAAWHAIFAHCSQHHSLTETLLKPARLAPVSLLLSDDAVVF